MIIKRVLSPARVREIPKQFSWLDQRLVTAGYVKSCDHRQLALYLILVTVGDSKGLSYYSDKAYTKLLKLNDSELRAARDGLIQQGLIAYDPPLYQVLALSSAGNQPQVCSEPRTAGPTLLAQILNAAAGKQ